MTICIDADLLREHLPFDFLEVFEVDSLEAPTTFIEHPPPANLAPPRTPKHQLVSRLANMAYVRAPERRLVYIGGDELPPDCGYNIIAVGIHGRKAPVVLFLYSRQLPSIEPDVNRLSAAVTTV